MEFVFKIPDQIHAEQMILELGLLENFNIFFIFLAKLAFFIVTEVIRNQSVIQIHVKNLNAPVHPNVHTNTGILFHETYSGIIHYLYRLNNCNVYIIIFQIYVQ